MQEINQLDLTELTEAPVPDVVNKEEVAEYCWSCRLCRTESQWIKSEEFVVPSGFTDDPILGMVCNPCLTKNRS